jgi:hypothetical protein
MTTGAESRRGRGAPNVAVSSFRSPYGRQLVLDAWRLPAIDLQRTGSEPIDGEVSREGWQTWPPRREACIRRRRGRAEARPARRRARTHARCASASPTSARWPHSVPESLETEAVVLDRGVQIGTVGPVSVRGSLASVTLDIDPRYAPLYRDATVRIGQRTAIGDAFVDVVRGSTTAGPIANGGAIARVSPNVDFDQAFATFTAPARTHATTLIRTFGVGAAAPQTAARWGLTVSQLSRVVQQAADLTAALDGQKSAISTLRERM